MPVTLKQLKAQRDNHLKKIEEYKAIAKDNGSDEIPPITINPRSFFDELFQESSERIACYISCFPYVNQILECTLKAAKEEKKRRECQQKIAYMLEKRGKKRKREDDEDEGEERRTSLRMKMIQDGNGEGTSQSMN